MKNQIKNCLIILFIITIIGGGIWGGRKISKYAEDIKSLKSEKGMLNSQKLLLEAQIKNEQNKIILKDRKIDSCMAVFKKKDKIIAGISEELNDALAKLNGITSDSSYMFLQQIAYNFPGTLEYLFNALQVKGIHADYLKARSSEKIIPVMTDQLNNCKLQFSERDSIEHGLNRVIKLQKQNLAICENINKDSDLIIKDTEKQRDKERRRKNFWRFSASVMTGVAVFVSVFGL